MKDLIEALTIFPKYSDTRWPTHCEHDVLSIVGITKKEMSKEDRDRVKKLGFNWNSDEEVWQSFRFGSA